jgi:hypothetical protein
MYKTAITFKDSLPVTDLEVLRAACEKAFDNRGGRAVGRSETTNRIIFEGEDSLFGCLQLGIVALNKTKGFRGCVSAWEWIDEEEPDESCDILKELSVRVH